MQKLIFIEKPFFVANFYDRLDEGFQLGMPVVLIDRKLKICCQRIVRKVFDQGNGRYLVDLI